MNRQQEAPKLEITYEEISETIAYFQSIGRLKKDQTITPKDYFIYKYSTNSIDLTTNDNQGHQQHGRTTL